MKNFVVELDSAIPWQMGFQDPATPVAEGIINFHHDLFFMLVLVVVFVGWLLIRCIYLFREDIHKNPDQFTHGTTIEVIWTLTPALMLMIIALPSFALLYSMDEVIDPSMTLKTIGHQWYWSYEYSDYETNDGEDFSFDSYMINTEDLGLGHLRLLEVDRRVVLPIETHIRVITTAADVIHSWAIPSLGIKLDACPGRLNQTSVYIKRAGTFYGQCSEICGINHGFMPIVITAVPVNQYLTWLSAKID
jgi:cytochrome c oxidase subunit 2